MKKKLKVLQLVLIISFLLFIFFLIKPKSYTKQYNINNVEIEESYNKNDNYYFTFKYQNITFDYLLESKYKQHTKLVNDVKIVLDEEDFCLIIKSKDFNIEPLCVKDNNIVHYSLVNDNLKEQIKDYFTKYSTKEINYKDIKIYNTDNTYLLWNYNGFYYINNNTKKDIDLFKKDIYNPSMISYTQDYLVLVDYDSTYTFNKIFTISFKNGDVKEYKIKPNINFDSYFIGFYKNNIYIVDNKEKLMYEFNAKNGEIEKIKSKILENGKWVNKNIDSIINRKMTFTYNTFYNYTLDNNNLYLSYKDKDIKTLVSNDVTNIVRIIDDKIFYLKKDTLYSFTRKEGEIKLLSFFEWNFNSLNMIYIN